MAEKTKTFHEDLVSALGEIQNPKKSADNPYFKSKYATLEESLKNAKEILKKNNLSVLQLNKSYMKVDKEQSDLMFAGHVLVTQILHTSGEYIEDSGVPIVSKDKNDPQKMGSAITYARRYGLMSMLGMVGTDDDDGNYASRPAQTKAKVKANPSEESLEQRVDKALSVKDLNTIREEYQTKINSLTPAQQKMIEVIFDKRKESLDANS